MALFDQFGQPMAQGPTTQQPQSNAVLDQAVSRMATSSERTLDTVKELHEVIKKMPTSVNEVSKKMENLGFELEDTVKFADDAADAMKQVAKIAGTLRRGIVNTKNLKDAVHAAEELAEAQKLIQQRARAGTKEYEQAAKAHKRLNEFAKAYANYQGESNDAMKEFSKVLHETVGDVDELQRKLKSVSLNHLTRQVHGVSKAMRAAGIDPFGMGTKMDKYVAGAEVKKKVREITEARKLGNVSAARERAEKAKVWVEERRDKLGLAGRDVQSPEFRAEVGRKMGMRGGRLAKYAGGGVEADAALEHGGGGMLRTMSSMAATGAESGIGGIAGMVGEFAPVLAVIEVLREMFDKFVAQNQDMEKSLGKAGLFAGGVGFSAARAAINPAGLGVSKLGFTFDRNLKMAGAMAEAGLAPEELVTGVGQDRANNRRGIGDEGFGKGGFGQMQRIAMTTGRLAGLTDTESITETVKLLQQYRETMESSDDFFIKVNKSAAAAGLTTTKYISIIDDVNSHFNAMNKNLNQTLSILTEMGKTGRLGSEDLKSYMDFLTTGGPPKSMADVATNAFTMMNMSPEQLKGIKTGARLDVKRAVQQAKDAGLGPISAEDMMGSGAQGRIQQLDLLLANNTTMSPDQKQNAMAALKALKQSANRFSRINSAGGAIGQAFGQGFGESPEELAQMNQSRMEIAIRKSGSSMHDFMSHPGQAGGRFKAMTGILQLLGLTPDKAMEAFEGRGAMATNMLQDFQQLGGETDTDIRDDKRLSAIAFLKEFKRADKAGALKIGLNDKTIDKLSDPTQTSADDLGSYFKEHGDLFATMASGMDTTGEYIQKGFHMDRKVNDDDRKKALDEAKKVGMQTQTTGDLIAGAFSKWFTAIISLLEKIASSPLLGGNKKDPAATAKIYNDNTQRANIAQLSIQKSMDEHLADMKEAEKKGDTEAYNRAQKQWENDQAQLEKLKQHSEYLDDANKWLEAISQSVGPSLDDVVGTEDNYMDIKSGYDVTGLPIGKDKLSELANDTYKALSSMGATQGSGGQLALGSQAWNNLGSHGKDLLEKLVGTGQLQYGGKDQSGASIYTVTNYYSADIQHSAASQQAVTGANPNEHPKTSAAPMKKN